MQLTWPYSLSRIWDWTFGGLPDWLVLPGMMGRWSQEITASDLANFPDVRRGALIDVRLDKAVLLTKSLSVPFAAKASIGQVVETHMRQSLPQGGANVLWSYEVAAPSKTSLDVRVYLFRRSDMAVLEDALHTAGVKVRTIDIAASNARPFVDNRARTDRLLRFWNGLTVALFAGVAVAVYVQQQSAIRSIEADIQSAQNRVATLVLETVELRSQSEISRSTAEELQAARDVFAFEHGRLKHLVGLSEALSDETWVSELTIQGTQLLFAAFTAGDVTDILERVSALPWVETAVLDGSVAFDRLSQENRFSLRVQLNQALEHQ